MLSRLLKNPDAKAGTPQYRHGVSRELGHAWKSRVPTPVSGPVPRRAGRPGRPSHPRPQEVGGRCPPRVEPALRLHVFRIRPVKPIWRMGVGGWQVGGMNDFRRRRKRHSPGDRAGILLAYHASGLTQRDFAARAGVSLGTLGQAKKHISSVKDLVLKHLDESNQTDNVPPCLGVW